MKSTLFYPMLLTTNNFLKKKIHRSAENKNKLVIYIKAHPMIMVTDLFNFYDLFYQSNVGHVMIRTVSFRFVIFQMHLSKGFIWHEDYSWRAKRMPAGEALDGGQLFLICWLPCDFMGACATKKDKKNIFSVPLSTSSLK